LFQNLPTLTERVVNNVGTEMRMQTDEDKSISIKNSSDNGTRS
jgi:hypothetical protein